MAVYSELLFHLEAASGWAEQGELHDIQKAIEGLIRRVRKNDDPGDDSGVPPPRGSGGLLSEGVN